MTRSEPDGRAGRYLNWLPGRAPQDQTPARYGLLSKLPRSKVPAMLEQMSAIAARHGVRIATVAHAGDGNLHPLILTPPGDSAARMAAQAAFEQFLDAAIALGGTVTGEHGVGILKREGMRRELDPGALALQAAVRRALDPREVFNPGKG